MALPHGPNQNQNRKFENHFIFHIYASRLCLIFYLAYQSSMPLVFGSIEAPRIDELGRLLQKKAELSSLTGAHGHNGPAA